MRPPLDGGDKPHYGAAQCVRNDPGQKGELQGAVMSLRQALPDPEQDGRTHVNVYSKGKTQAGRFMSNFAQAPFFHPEYGRFESVEGLWYWLSCRDDRLRLLYGFEAKKLGRELRAKDWPQDEKFQKDIVIGIEAKLAANPKGAALVKAIPLTVPLLHYYNMRGRVIDLTDKSLWMLRVFDNYRTYAL